MLSLTGSVCKGFATRGAAAIIMEATAVVPEGRISPEDAVRRRERRRARHREFGGHRRMGRPEALACPYWVE